MKQIVLGDIDLLEVGHTIQISGIIFSSKDIDYFCLLPEYQTVYRIDKVFLDMTQDDWIKFFRQTDMLETEILAQDKTGSLVKIILRKAERQIDQNVSWRVFKRDDYTCRYCGKTGIPLTVDHIILWEDGGPSIEENLLSSCRKCNKTRGRTKYKDWLMSDYYKYNVSVGLLTQVLLENKALLDTLHKIPIRIHRKSR